MKIAVIGAGWFGCHLANELIKDNHKVKIFEKNKKIFSKASLYNTGRLHLGFHYPRSYKTRLRSLLNFNKFKEKYPQVCEPVDVNLYLVAAENSLLDFPTYLEIAKSTGLEYQTVDPKTYGFENIEGALLCKEETVNPLKARSYFENMLLEHLSLNTAVEHVKQESDSIMVNNESFDYCINCTYNTFSPVLKPSDIVFENVVSLIVEPLKNDWDMSFVVMDGEFFSFNKAFLEGKEESELYGLYHVKHSVVNRSTQFEDTVEFYKANKNKSFEEALDYKSLLEDVDYIFPLFKKYFKVVGHTSTIRTSLDNYNANRECIVSSEGKYINVMSGKISSIFDAEDSVKEIIKAN